jgi:ubiquinone/menaquinone biosynthesis C-methylase UbiE
VINVTFSNIYKNRMDLKQIIGTTDIYLLDQIVKNRYVFGDKILDAGCGSGRNIHWFYNNNFDVWGIDRDSQSVERIMKLYPKLAKNFSIAKLTQLPFRDDFFDHIICSAVLHFALKKKQFQAMFSELVRTLKPGGSLFVRMASDIGVENKISFIENGVYKLGDGTDRFLLTRKLLQDLMEIHSLSFLEPLKTTNVNDLRCMSTLMLQNPASQKI